MRNLDINQTNDVFYKFPIITFNGSTGECLIEGEAFMDNPKKFFEPVFEWMHEFAKDTTLTELKLDIKLSYMNTSSSKSIFDLMVALRKIEEENEKDVEVNWYFDAEDFEMEDDIIDFIEDTGMQITPIPVSS